MPLMPWEKSTTGCCSDPFTSGAPCRHASALCKCDAVPCTSHVSLHVHASAHASDCVASRHAMLQQCCAQPTSLTQVARQQGRTRKLSASAWWPSQ